VLQYAIFTGNAEIAGLDNDGLDNDGLDIDGLDNDGLDIAGLDIAGLDIAELDNDGRMPGQLTELKLRRFSLGVFETYALLVLRCY